MNHDTAMAQLLRDLSDGRHPVTGGAIDEVNAASLLSDPEVRGVLHHAADRLLVTAEPTAAAPKPASPASPKTWTDEEKQRFAQMSALGCKRAALAAEFGITLAQVDYQRKKCRQGEVGVAYVQERQAHGLVIKVQFPAVEPRPVQPLPINHSVPWSADEDQQLRSELQAGMKAKDIAKVHGRTLQSVRSRVKKLAKQAAAVSSSTE